MDRRKILRQLSEIFGVDEESLPKILRRFKKEIEEMEFRLYGN